MRTYDFAPLYRSTVGFDRLFSLLDQAAQVETSTALPPYNIEKVAEDAVARCRERPKNSSPIGLQSNWTPPFAARARKPLRRSSASRSWGRAG